MGLILTPQYICQPASWPAGSRHESRTKIVFFFENNAVDRTTFTGRPTESVGPIVCALLILDLPYLAHISSL